MASNPARGGRIGSVLFRAAAGSRIGFGHLMRCGVLADALGVPRRLSLRATPAVQRRAEALGWTVLAGGRAALDTARPTLIVVDDPSAAHVSTWVRQARRRAIPVATVHDLGLGRVVADLSIDGSLVHPAAARCADLQGPAFTILDPRVARLRARPFKRHRRQVLVTLGGGTSGRTMAVGVAAGIAARTGATVRIAAGFAGPRRGRLPAGCRWIDAPGGLAPLLARATVAVVAGGVTLYEACALGTPAVAMAVAPAQRLTIRAASRAGAVLEAGRGPEGRMVARAVATVERLLDDPQARRSLARRARALVDGGGTARVVRAIRALAAAGKGRHAA